LSRSGTPASEALLLLAESRGAEEILILTSPIRLGEKPSICTKIIERLSCSSGDVNERAQYAYDGRVGGCLITGNENGVKHCVMGILHSFQHPGYVIPPQADAGCRVDARNPEYR
jgi:multimeric flavodoxin WrbA